MKVTFVSRCALIRSDPFGVSPSHPIEYTFLSCDARLYVGQFIHFNQKLAEDLVREYLLCDLPQNVRLCEK